jgi:hypothetical protein
LEARLNEINKLSRKKCIFAKSYSKKLEIGLNKCPREEFSAGKNRVRRNHATRSAQLPPGKEPI